MGRWVTKLRGLLGLGLIGGAVGGLFGGLWWLGTDVLGMGEIAFGSLGWTVGLWGGFGAFATTGVGVLLATVGAKRTLEELSPAWAGLAGGAMGGVAPFGLAFALTGDLMAPWIFIIAGTSALVGGLLSGGLVLTAKRAQSAELQGTLVSCNSDSLKNRGCRCAAQARRDDEE